MAQLIIISRNQQPQRDARYPRTWWLTTQHGRESRLAVTRIGSQPRVKEKGSAA